MPAGEVGEKIRLRAFRTRIGRPFLAFQHADAVHQVTAPEIVVHEMATSADPVGGDRTHVTFRQTVRRNGRAPGDTSGEMRVVGTEHYLADGGMDAVAADQDVTFDHLAGGEHGTDTAVRLLNGRHFRIQADSVGCGGARGRLKYAVKIRAMHVVVRKAESFDAAFAKRTRNQRLARFPMPHLAPFRAEDDFRQFALETEVVQHAGAVSADLYSCADFAEPRCLLQHHDLEIRPREGQRQR